MNNGTIIQRLMNLTAQRFGLDRDKLNADDDLYETLGIDSLQALDLLTDLEEAFDVEIPDYELQDARTFSSLATIIGRRA